MVGIQFVFYVCELIVLIVNSIVFFFDAYGLI